MFFCSFVNSFVRCCCCQRMSCQSVKSDTLTLFLEYVSYNIFVSMCFLSLNFVLLLFRLAKSRRISRHYSAILFSSKWCNRFSSNKFESIVCFFPRVSWGKWTWLDYWPHPLLSVRLLYDDELWSYTVRKRKYKKSTTTKIHKRHFLKRKLHS
jgi:hypothetical protein